MRVDPSYINNLVSAMDQAQANEQQYSSELSSGVRVTSLSTDPVAAGQNVLLLNEIQQDDSFTQSASEVTGQLNVADSTLGSVITQLTQAISLATSANNGTMNASDANSIASELEGIRSEIVTLGNTEYQGQYIFSGSVTSSEPFDGTGNYSGNSTVNYMETPNNQKIQLNVSGDQIFNGNGNSTVSVFGALNALISDYSSVTSTTPLNTQQAASDTATLNGALNWVSQQRVTIDNSISQLSAASSSATNEGAQLTSAQTNLMQADVGQVATQLSLAQTQQQALEDTISEIGSDSLFSKLQY